MRKIDWDKELSEEDIAWLRQAGIVGMEERIVRHQEQFDADVPDVEIPSDTVTVSADDATGRANRPTGVETGGPIKVDPTQADPQQDEDDEDDEGDDYDTWPVADLEQEVTARNDLANDSDGKIGSVEVHGTGKDGRLLKADLIKGLRLWDVENPGAIKPSE